MTEDDTGPPPPSLPWRIGSTVVMAVVGSAFRLLLTGPNSVKVEGLDRFLDLLDERADEEKRERGLITGQIPVKANGANVPTD